MAKRRSPGRARGRCAVDQPEACGGALGTCNSLQSDSASRCRPAYVISSTRLARSNTVTHDQRAFFDEASKISSACFPARRG